jgi:hypothetical protein
MKSLIFYAPIGGRQNAHRSEGGRDVAKSIVTLAAVALAAVFLAYKQWDKQREIHTLISRLRSSGAL